MLLMTSILSAAVVGVIGYQSGQSSLRASAFDRLTEIRESQTRQLQAEIGDLQNSLVVYSRGSTATEAIQAYTAGFDQLNNATITPAQQQAIGKYYNEVFVKRTRLQDRRRLSTSSLAADLERPEVSAGLLHGALHRLGLGDQVRRCQRRQRLVGCQRPVQRLLPSDRDPHSSSRTPCCSTPGATSSTAPTRASTSAPTSSPGRTAAAI